MKVWKALSVIATSATVLAMGTAGIATASSPFHKFGHGTGIHSVTYNGGFTSSMSRGGSGVVEQWVAPTAGNHGSYYLYKPLSNGSITTPFKQSCDEPALVAFGATPWTYNSANYTPAGVLSDYFPIDGLTYWVCVGSASSYATADYTYTVGGTGPTRHATFDVQTAGPGFPASGTFNYSDTDAASYTVNVTDVLISGSVVTFSGPMPGGTTWLEAQVTMGPGGTVASAGGDVVSSDPAGTLGTFTPSTMADATPTGTMFIYTL